jgi:hypothetical protein
MTRMSLEGGYNLTGAPAAVQPAQRTRMLPLQIG